MSMNTHSRNGNPQQRSVMFEPAKTSQAPRKVARNPPKTAHDSSNLSHGSANVTRGSPTITHGPPTITRGPPTITHGSPTITHRSSTGARSSPVLAHSSPTLTRSADIVLRSSPTGHGSPIARRSPVHTVQQGSINLPTSLVNCPVCKKPYREPKLLTCLHSFCQDCLVSSLAASRVGPGHPFLCPLCHTECVIPKKGVSGLADNVLLHSVKQLQRQRSVPVTPNCTGCDSGETAQAKCIECKDWLCRQCCDIHRRVKVTRSHHIVSPDELDTGQADSLIKANFDEQLCEKHQEPLKLFCNDLDCQIPICTVCKTTLGHDGHEAIELEERARWDVNFMQSLFPGLNKSIQGYETKSKNIQDDDKLTSTLRKQMHKDINDRLTKVSQNLIENLGTYAEAMHNKVDQLAKDHKQDLNAEQESCRLALAAHQCAQSLAMGLLEFGRTEEVVRMSMPVNSRLQSLQQPPDTNPPGWRRPRLHPAQAPTDTQLALLFGELTFEGHLIASQMLRSFSAVVQGDTRKCSLSDVSLSADDDIIIVDKDNKKMKVFTSTGELLFTTEGTELKDPIRATVLCGSGDVIIKDDKVLKLMKSDGEVAGKFAHKVRHPMAMAQTKHGEVLISDWNSGNVHCFTAQDQEVYSFSSNLEAPAYISDTPGGGAVVSDWKQNVVRAFARGGKLLWQYGKNDGHQLNHPYGICSDRYGHVLVADSWNHRIHLISEDGRFLRYLLNKDSGLHFPQALGLTKEGHLVVAELNGNVKIFQYLA